MNLVFAHSLKPAKIFILSEKHGLVDLEQVIEPYEQTLNTMSMHEIKNWAEKVKQQMIGKVDFDKLEYIHGRQG